MCKGGEKSAVREIFQIVSGSLVRICPQVFPILSVYNVNVHRTGAWHIYVVSVRASFDIHDCLVFDTRRPTGTSIAKCQDIAIHALPGLGNLSTCHDSLRILRD